jgi:hypothetical protein
MIGMSETTKMHFLKISGIVTLAKKREFEHTIKFASELLTRDCVEISFGNEIFQRDAYYFFTCWVSAQALKKFMSSEEYHLIRSAYDALGLLHKIEIGYDVEIKTIRINQL